MATNKKPKNTVRTGPRNIVTNYYGTSGKVKLWTNRGYNADNAVDNAFRWMRRNEYGAFVAEVFNEDNGELYAVIIHSKVGEIRTLFRYDPATKVVVTNFDPVLIESITSGPDLELVEKILRESGREKKLQEQVQLAKGKLHGQTA